MSDFFLPDVKAKIENLQDANKRQEYKLVGQIKLKPGMKLFQLNTETMEIIEVEIISKVHIGTDFQPIKEHRAHYNPKCIYVPAINKKNAERKILKMINQTQTP